MTAITSIQQLSLFSTATSSHKANDIPAAVTQALDLGAALAISVSGGKDSDAMLRHLVSLHQKRRWPGELFAITADLGRIEWPGTLEHIQAICNELDVPLVIVRRQRGGMIDRWDQRRQTLLAQQTLNSSEVIASSKGNAIPHLLDDKTGELRPEGSKPFWSSDAARYCTKELKTAEVDRYLRRFKSVVCAVGIRAQESPSRAKKARVMVRNDIATASLKAAKGLDAIAHEQWADKAISRWLTGGCKGRLALSWNSILDWPIERVWQTLGCSTEELEGRRALYQSGCLLEALQGWPAHWAYVSGNSRLSCSMCVLASLADIHNGARHNVSTWLELALMEARSRWSFQQGRWLSDLSIGVKDRLARGKALHKVLQRLHLVKPWPRRFVIALLTNLPTTVLSLWLDVALLSMVSIVQESQV